MPTRHSHVHAAIAVIERRGRVLICRRRPGDYLGGYWEFPGGKRRPGESWPACLRRELREELGIAVRALRPYMRIRHGYRDRRVHFRVFRCALARGRPRPLEATALRWVRVPALRRFRFPRANARLIERLTGGCPSETRVI